MPKKIILVILMIFAVSAAVFCAPDYYEDDIYFFTGVDSGLGGPYPTDNSSLESIFANPAAFKSTPEELVFSDLTLLLKGPIFDITTLVINSVSGGGDITSILSSPSTQSLLSSMYAGFTLTGPLFFGYVGNGIGFGLFNSTDFLLQGTGPISLSMGLSEDVLLAGGYSFRIPLSKDEKHALDIGILLKGGVQGSMVIEKSYLELISLFSSLSPDIIMSEPFEFSTIIGVDAGMQYIWNGVLSAGISFQDCFSPAVKYTYDTGLTGFMEAAEPSVENGLIPFKMNAGLEISPDIPAIQEWISDFRFMLAYDDILDFVLYPTEAENWLLHLKTGLEITMLEILDIRVGLAEGLLNAGFGLDLQIFEVNAAMFGTERTSQPNTKADFNLVLGFKF